MTKLKPTSIQAFFQDATKKSINQNPLKNLFAGCGPAVLGIIPYMGINFAMYDYLVRRNEKTKVGDAGAAGAIAGKRLLILYSSNTTQQAFKICLTDETYIIS